MRIGEVRWERVARRGFSVGLRRVPGDGRIILGGKFESEGDVCNLLFFFICCSVPATVRRDVSIKESSN